MTTSLVTPLPQANVGTAAACASLSTPVNARPALSTTATAMGLEPVVRPIDNSSASADFMV